MPFLFSRGNEAVEVNPPSGLDFHITDHGSDWLWAGFSVMVLAFILSVLSSYLKVRSERFFHYFTSIALFIMSILYFTMASNLGWTGIQAEFNHVTTEDQMAMPGVRQIFYARYVGWFLAFPCFFLNFAAYSGASWGTSFFTIACQWVTVLCLLFGSLVHSTYKWGYFVFAVMGYLFVAYNFLFPFRAANALHGSRMAGLIVAGSSLLLLMLYFICWALSEGANVIQPDSEMVFYGVLDVIFFAIVSPSLLYFARGWDFTERRLATYDTPIFARAAPATHFATTEKVAPHHPVVHDRHSGETAADHAAHVEPTRVEPTVAASDHAATQV